MYIINSIAPIFLLIALGKLLHKSGIFSEAFFKGLNTFVFWLALPALLTVKISSGSFQLGSVANVFLLFAAGVISTQILAWIISRLIKLSPPQAGSFIQGSFRGNNAFIGLPIIIYAFPEAEAEAILVFGPTVILYNLLAAVTLIHHGQSHKNMGHAFWILISKTFKNPLILACILGMFLQYIKLEIPLFASRTLNVLGSTSLPLALISIGAAISFTNLRGTAAPSLISSMLKLVFSPAIGLLLAPFFGVSDMGRMIAVITLACPTAVSSYVMAEAMGNDSTIAGRIIVLSTLLSAITLPIIIALGDFM